MSQDELLYGVMQTQTSRRYFLKSLGHVGLMSLTATSEILTAARSSQASVMPVNSFLSTTTPELSLSLYNTHTGESLKNHVFWSEGTFIKDQLQAINHHFRDYRTGEVHPIDPELLKLLAAITGLVDSKEAIHLVSGYRSPKTNKMLAVKSTGVAQKSQHLYGKAADIIIPGRNLKQIQRAAKSLKAGGVGRYSSFVHVDTGRVRSWGLPA